MVDVPANTSTTAVFQFSNDGAAGVFDGVFEPFIATPDADWVRFDVASTSSYQLYLSMQGSGASTTAGPKISIYNSAGGLINSFFFDGSGNVKTGTLNFTAGTFFIEATTSSGTQIGSYSLGITSVIRTDLFLTSGNDVVPPSTGGRHLGGYGNDIINLSSTFASGPDAMGDQGNDELTGNSDANRLWGGTGGDTLIGLGGNDILFGGHDDDLLLGGNDDDQLFGGRGSDVLSGNAGIDQLEGGEGDDYLLGGSEGDFLDGGTGLDVLEGGAGDDVYTINDAAAVIIESAGDTFDLVRCSVSYELAADDHIEVLVTTNLSLTTSINLTGNELMGQIINGNNGANQLSGGVDFFSDSLFGFAGNDTYLLGNSTNDTVSDTAGIDTITSSISRSLGSFAGIENLTLIGNAVANATGTSGANKLVGNAAANNIVGSAGNDTLTGGNGRDNFYFNSATNSATNVDTITDFSVFDDTIRLENGIFTKLVGNNNTTLSLAQFFKGTAAHDADDRIIYNSLTGALIYDSNGNGTGGAVQIATLSKGLLMTQADFFIV